MSGVVLLADLDRMVEVLAALLPSVRRIASYSCCDLSHRIASENKVDCFLTHFAKDLSVLTVYFIIIHSLLLQMLALQLECTLLTLSKSWMM